MENGNSQQYQILFKMKSIQKILTLKMRNNKMKVRMRMRMKNKMKNKMKLNNRTFKKKKMNTKMKMKKNIINKIKKIKFFKFIIMEQLFIPDYKNN